MSIRSLKIIIAVAAALAVSGAVCAQQYTVTDLGTLGGDESRAYAINSRGQVVGYSASPSGDFHAFMWDGTMHDLGVIFGANEKAPFAIDDAGAVIGLSFNYGDLYDQAFRWQNGVASFLGNFTARGANNAGQIVGFTSLAGTSLARIDHACLWQFGVLTDLGTLGGSFSYAFDINGLGQAVGSSFLAGDMINHACMWWNGTSLDLGTLGGTSSQATAVNDMGWAVGYSDTAAGAPHACLFRIDSFGNVASRTDLGDLNTGYSYASGVNNLGQIVGNAGRAFIWHAGTMTDLNSLAPNSGWKFAAAAAINDGVQIVGWGVNPAGHLRAFLLQPADSIPAIKALPQGATTNLTDNIVTAAFGGYFYMESPKRLGGIRVDKAAHGVQVGQQVSVSGVVTTNSDGERCIAATTATPSVAPVQVTPLYVNNTQLGGGDFQYDSVKATGQRGISGATGLCNIGLLVRTTGIVKPNDATSFFIDDGSHRRVRVVVPAGVSLPPVDHQVIVTGISSCEATGSDLTRLLRVRGPEDIRPL